MKNNFYIIVAMLSILMFESCNLNGNSILDETAYQQFLSQDADQYRELVKNEIDFWSNKLEIKPDQFPYMVQMSIAETDLFRLNGKSKHLITAHDLLLRANEQTNFKNAGYLRMLASNLMSQHKFKRALEYLEMAELNGEDLEATEKMLFDVLFDLGENDKAETYLKSFQDEKDFDYLIRMAKWQDRVGNLGKAIDYLEKARDKAEEMNNKNLKEWTYSNLADFYGHDGQIEKSYKYHLKSLELNPINHHSKKGIAWILYSHLDKPEEALEVLEDISNYNASPDYLVLKAEIAAYMGNEKLKESLINQYMGSIVKNNQQMYNAYSIPLLAEELSETELAVQLAENEVDERPTTASYDLLAWTHFLNGDHIRALQIIDNKVYNKTFEPMALYHMLKIYKTTGDEVRVKKLRQELEGTEFELGPVISNEIQKI